MDTDRVTNLGFSIDSISTGGLLSGSVDLTVQATQIVHATTCAVFQSEYSEDDSLIFELLDLGIVNEYMAEYIKKRLSGAKQGSILNPKSSGRKKNNRPNKVHFSWYLMVRHAELINEITKTKALKLVTDTQLKTISPETINSSIKRIKKKVLVALGEEPDLDLVTLWCKNTNTIIAPRKEK
jgi:hypothetical protein